MVKNEKEISPGTHKNKNDVKVNNQFSLTINFGDSLNLLALITGIFVIRRIGKRNRMKKKEQKAAG
ncbi:hypothetical protein E2K98_07335 [Bacillus salipaludis]|uniref:Uncharacterized protein n=1 Tax=Bacillus salipaludis TaxID=2547811 RepID=A0A4R5VXS9_9BACI|nr:hypothetical protein [Bacillus salipaludis]MDQ6597308.1 hypothetical protein [Bacillus salipaludis]TDK63252.1 hypothetical protein E2K98_07335 [Bacillus salipaludis]